jgi:hypothetical protein
MFFGGHGRKGALNWSIGFLRILVILALAKQLSDLMILGIFKMLQTK